MKLTAENVETIFLDCLFNEGEPKEPNIKSEGVVMTAFFHPQRLELHRMDVSELLGQLPQQFKEEGGGGWSFLAACMTAEDEQWGEHRNIEQLFLLGNALGLSQWCMPRSMWSALPGSMPYAVVKTPAASI